MLEKFTKPYNPADTEDRIYKMWLESGYFNPDNLSKGSGEKSADGSARFTEPFSIVLPPPNVTGTLHMGSALMLAIEDIMVRYARMKGKKTLWIPGTDHAAIATQSKVEKEISKKEGKSRHDLGREELLRRVDAFATESHDAIVNQMKKMGCSIDWSREAFTLDEKRNLAVRTAFKKMYDDGLIYRGYRVVNWDPKGQTTISDDEIVYEARKAKLYTFKYGKDSKTGDLIPISISTTRPETKLGDTGIAVHPDDKRYAKLIGREFDTIFAGESIHLKVIADASVDPEFGTGALGVTPAHSIADWEMAQRHGLPLKQVINEYAKMTVGNESIKDKKAVDAREAVVAWLRAENLLEKEEEIDQNVSTAERTGGIVEPLPKLQWFVAVNKKIASHGNKTLKELMIESVAPGGISIIPDRFEKVYLHWIENLRDWCISRQIWYGHRIPVWYRGEAQKPDEIYVGVNAPKGAGKKETAAGDWKQDEDTLDTWFSSGLWTFSTLGWPDEKEFAANRAYHPTTILETGSDILFFWVARMILMSTYLLGEIPFKTVYLHGLVRDGQGRKISKSLGNNVEPLDMIAKYGADAVRMSLIVAVGPGNDSKVGEDKIKAYKNFANKLWNITRFILSSAQAGIGDGKAVAYDPNFKKWTSADAAYVERLNALVDEATREMDEYKFYLVGEKLYHYAWHEFADKILEESKPIIGGFGAGGSIVAGTGTAEEKTSRLQFLLHAHRTILKLLHPFMPYVTEEIWGSLEKHPLIIEAWPVKN